MTLTPSFDWSLRRALVTGCTGFVGSHLCDELVARGATVVGLVRDAVPDSVRGTVLWNSSRVIAVRGDLTDAVLLERAINEYEIDTVFHLGAQTIVPTANRAPLSTFESNVRGTWCLLEACRRVGGVERIVVASSDKAYGDADHVPIAETAPLLGRHPYDASKACAEIACLAFHATYGLPIAITRCGNVFGARDLNWNRLVPGTIRSALRGEAPVIRSDGGLVRDWFYVDDAVAAYLRLAERLVPDKLAGEAFNFSNEAPASVLDVVATLLRRLGSPLSPRVLGIAKAEIRIQSLSSAKARERLDWRPRFGLEDALDATIAWYRAFLESPEERGGRR